MLESNLAFEFVLDDDFEFPTEQEEPSTWKISDEATADWAIRQIKAERARRDIYINAAKEHIASLNDKITHMQEQCDKKTAFLLSRLNDYLDVLPVKKTKTQVSFDLPSGKLVRKNSYQSFERDDAKLMEYVHCSSPELIKIKERNRLELTEKGLGYCEWDRRSKIYWRGRYRRIGYRKARDVRC